MNGKNAIWYAQAIDNSGLRKGQSEAKAIWQQMGNDAEQAGQRVDKIWRGVGTTIAGISIGGFIKQMYQVRASFQDAESALTLFLGSADKAGSFMKELQDYAWYNAFEFEDLVAQSKQLLAYGNAVETVIPTLDQLSNVAIATRQPLQSLVDLYNKAKNLGSIDSVGLKQWASAGLVLTDVLDDLGEKVDGTSVSFEQLEKALNHVTSEGGLFYKQMETMMPNLSMSLGQLQDDITNMFNELGKQSEGVMKGAIEAASSLVANYEKIGKTIVGLIGTYGAYRAAVMLATAASKSWTIAELAHYNILVLVNKAQKLLSATMLKNPLVLFTTLAVGAATAMWALRDSTTAAEKAQKNHNDRLGEAKSKFDELTSIVRDETKAISDRQEALEKLRSIYPGLFNDMDIESVKLANIANLTKQAALADLERQKTIAQGRIAELNVQIAQKTSSLQSGANSGAISQAAIKRQIANLEDKKKAHESIIKQYNDQLEREDELRKKAEEEAANAPQNKAYWDNIKKEAQAALDAMDVSLKGTAEWKALEAKIAKADAQIKKYSGDKSTVKKAEKSGETYAELLDKQQLERIRKAEDFQMQISQASIDAMADGADKERAQRELDYQKGVKQIERQQQDMLRKKIEDAKELFEANPQNKGKVFDSTGITLTEDELLGFDSLRKFLDKSYSNLDGLLEKYATFEDRRNKIIAEGDSEAKDLRNAGYEEQAREAEKATKKRLSKLEREVIEETDIWKRLFNDFGDITTDTLIELFNQAEQLINDSTDLSAEDIKILKERLEEASQEIKSRNPFKSLEKAYSAYKETLKSGTQNDQKKAWNEVLKATSLVKNNISAIGESVSGLVGVINNDLGESFSTVFSIIEKGIGVFESFGQKGKGGAKNVGETIQGAKDIVSLITTIIGGIVKAFDRSAEKARKAAEEAHRQESYWVSINYQVERYIKLLDKVSGFEYLDASNRALKALNTGYDSAISELNKTFKKASVAPLDGIMLVGGLAILMDGAGSSLDDLLDGELEALYVAKEHEAIWAIIPEEMQQAIDKAIDYAEQIEELNQQLARDLFQTTSSEMEDAILNWLKAGEKGIDEMGDYFGEVMRDALLQSWMLSEGGLRDRIQDFYKKYTAYADSNSDGQLDLSQSEINSLNKEWQEILSWAQDEANALTSILGDINNSSRKATERGIASASQDSVDELNGRMTVIQSHTFDLRENSNFLVEQSKRVIEQWQGFQAHNAQVLRYLSGIEDNTTFCRRLEPIQNTLNDIATRGVIVRG